MSGALNIGYKSSAHKLHDLRSIFDINIIMNEEHLRGYSSLSMLPEPPKRKRTPSQYAAQIADFKNVRPT